MDLKIQGKVVIITKDVGGIYHHILELLKIEGAIPILVNTDELVDLKKQIDANPNQAIKNMEIDAFVNINDSNFKMQHDDILMYFYKHSELSNRLSNNFSIINIGTRDALSIQGDSYNIGLTNFDVKESTFEDFFRYKVNTIVYSEIEDITKSIKENHVCEIIGESLSVKNHIANTISLLISKISKNIKNQIIFIDKGGHLFQGC